VVRSHSLTPLLAILVDGLRHDYVNQDDAPFLWEMQQESLSGVVRESFAGQLRPVFFAGLYPNRSGVGHLFCYDPDHSPFWPARYVPSWAAALPRLGPMLRDRLARRARRIEARRGHTASSLYGYVAEIPWRYLPLFAFSETKSPTDPGTYCSPSLFDLMREAGMNWLYVGYPYDDQRTDKVLSTFRARWQQNEQFVFLHFAEVDWLGHLGPHSAARRAALHSVDAAARMVFEEMLQRGPRPNLLVFGDHGMVEVRKVVNLYPVLAQLGLKPGRDYAFFLDSMLARFWFATDRARNRVGEALSALPHGRVLDAAALARYGLAGAPRRLGELFYVMQGGIVLFPDFFQGTVPARGMHGYLPEEEENWAAIILQADEAGGRLSQPVDLIDVFPVMAELLGLPVPNGCQGRSFLPRT
jgi:hypothetical protein